MEMEHHVLVYVLEPDYSEYLAPSDDAIPVKDQSLSPGYIADSDPEEDHEEDLADYPTDGRDNDDDDESFGDDDDDDNVEEDEEEEEEHLAPADSTAFASPTVDHVPS
ncbi:hypothetical protein Tco_0126052, partial [Tanacetum coccineum]